MFKFLRKYNKWILAVGGTLLMIVFLIPQAIQSLSQRAATGGATWAIVDGETVTAGRRQEAANELMVFDRIKNVVNATLVGPLDIYNDPAHWYLLVREAEDAGVVPARSFLPPEQLSAIMGRAGQNPFVVEQALARLSGVNQLIATYVNAGKFSDRRLKEYGARLMHAVNAQIVVISADPDAVDWTPSDDEILAQFEKYADVLPGEGEGEEPFGYQLPDRAKLEWLSIDEDDVREVVRASDAMSRKELIKHWMRNPDNAFPPYEAGREMPVRVNDDLLNRLTQEKLDEIAKFGYDQLRARHRGLPEQEGYYVLPDDWREQQLPLPALAEQIRERFGVPLPAYEASGDRWLTMEDIDEIDGLGNARTDKFGNPLSTRELVQAAREFGGSAVARMQAGVAAPAMRSGIRGQDGSVHLFRISATDASRRPHSVDEVRDEVIADLRKIRHYEQLVAAASGIEQQARRDGLLATALDHDTTVQRSTTVSRYDPFILNLQQRQNAPLNPIPTSLPVIGPDQDVIERIIATALTLPTGSEFNDLPRAERTFVFPVAGHHALLVVELTGQQPLIEPVYRTIVSQGWLQQFLIAEEFGIDVNVIEQAFGFDALAQRHSFKIDQDSPYSRPTETPEEPEDAGQASAAMGG